MFRVDLFLAVISFLQGQRTVYRLTLVKAWNTDELQNYADLVSRGRPDFIEIKVTDSEDLMKLDLVEYYFK